MKNFLVSIGLVIYPLQPHFLAFSLLPTPYLYFLNPASLALKPRNRLVDRFIIIFLNLDMVCSFTAISHIKSGAYFNLIYSLLWSLGVFCQREVLVRVCWAINIGMG